jgi:hypothetical protein
MAEVHDTGSVNTRTAKGSGARKRASADAKSAMAATRKRTSASPENVDVNEMIRTAAYFRSERRGFAAGADLQDWLEAEAEINRIR